MEDIDKGTYTLVMFLKEPMRLKIGALGELYFNEGYYAYTGSALGSGGFVRVKRHRAVASGKNRTKQWHIDYLLPHVEVVDVVTSPRPECSVAGSIDQFLARVPGFGCSDCRCPTHLHYAEDLEKMKKVVQEAHHVT
ncbi:MAG TPA: GIY-YIG nuclease family protein [Methanocella sp.]|uniref:GIY-YIG nuclease family protein n=1 Tax=Methanocella sp. TaxID=2052833 RepID=UPI002C9AB04F|nr:GIY-YIG nuclease family protein [Methanocella sp.]HTY90287.1 GIY-YIG nuclease family protein [Methanocella sp.]